MSEPPLTEREVRMLRGMLDEYDYRLRQRRQRSSLVGDVRVVLAVAGASVVLTLNLVTLYLVAFGH